MVRKKQSKLSAKAKNLDVSAKTNFVTASATTPAIRPKKKSFKVSATASAAAGGADSALAHKLSSSHASKEDVSLTNSSKAPKAASQDASSSKGQDRSQAAGSNWLLLKAQLSTEPQRFRQHKKRRRDAEKAAAAAAEEAAVPIEARSRVPEAIKDNSSLTPVVAVDCEMVGVGPDGLRSELARVCIVNDHGTVLIDAFSKPKERVTDFRTRFSGIRPADIRTAPPFADVQRQVAAILKGRTIVGHSISNDLKALLLGHPWKHIRDTARFPPLMLPRRPGGQSRPRALRELAAEQLGLTIQEGEHSPVDDARASLYLYHKYKQEWEGELREHGSTKRMKSLLAGTGRRAAAKSLEKLAENHHLMDL